MKEEREKTKNRKEERRENIAREKREKTDKIDRKKYESRVLHNDCQDRFVSETVLHKTKRDKVKEKRENRRDRMKKMRENIRTANKQKRDEANALTIERKNSKSRVLHIPELIPPNVCRKQKNKRNELHCIDESIVRFKQKVKMCKKKSCHLGNHKEGTNCKAHSVKYKQNVKNFNGKVSITNRCVKNTRMNSASTWKCSHMANVRRKRKLLEKLKRYHNNIISKRYRTRRVKTLADCTHIFNEKTWSNICMYCVFANMVPCISFKCVKYHLDIRHPEGNISRVHTTL